MNTAREREPEQAKTLVRESEGPVIGRKEIYRSERLVKIRVEPCEWMLMPQRHGHFCLLKPDRFPKPVRFVTEVRDD
jgi:hypothetical protein